MQNLGQYLAHNYPEARNDMGADYYLQAVDGVPTLLEWRLETPPPTPEDLAAWSPPVPDIDALDVLESQAKEATTILGLRAVVQDLIAIVRRQHANRV